MSITLYSASVPVFSALLENLLGWLDKAEAHAATKKFEPAIYLDSRLAPDMLPLRNQVQIACDTAKFFVARLAGVDAPKFDDKEASLADLRTRVRATLDFIASVPAERIEGTEAKEVTLPRRTGAVVMQGQAYLTQFALPNFFFHVTTTYALLRHAGVDIGKQDYLGAPQPR
ncbi:MAG: DUF1993 domain-containing protein [Pseudomonadota bacterium]|nr:DUF1993 domain-containing protein [Pseudomonadota bacterium]